MRLRVTAQPSLRVTVNPKREPSAHFAATGRAAVSVTCGRRLPSMRKPGPDHLNPPRMRRNSTDRLSVHNRMAPSGRPVCATGPFDLLRGLDVTPSRPTLSRPTLCRKPLAALGPAAGDDANATNSRHTLAEAVAALAHEAAWLIGPFHVIVSILGRRLMQRREKSDRPPADWRSLCAKSVGRYLFLGRGAYSWGRRPRQ